MGVALSAAEHPAKYLGMHSGPFSMQQWSAIDASAEINRLDPRRALAFAELLQVMSCGEESATATFENLAHSSPADSAFRATFLRIAADERRHQHLLTFLCGQLPRPAPDSAFEARMRRFFMRLAHRDLQVHFVRIAALDSAACRLLGLLRGPRGPLPARGSAMSVLRSIHMDEARHVQLALRCAGRLADCAKGLDIAAEVRADLTGLVQARGDSLEVLGIDPDRLTARLRSTPARSDEAVKWLD